MTGGAANSPFIVGALGVGWPERLPTFVRKLERCGYGHFWATEHHSVHQSASPLAATAVAAATSTRLSVGTAGIMLRYLTPLRVAKDAHFLEMLYPGRIDIGTIGGFAASPHSALHGALKPWAASDELYLAAFAELVAYVRVAPESYGREAMQMCGHPCSVPRLWLCSNNAVSAQFAGEQSVGFIVHLPQAMAPGLRLAKDAIDTYRKAFVPSEWMHKPRVGVVCAGICAESDAEAWGVWPRYVARTLALRSQTGPPSSHASPDLEAPLSTFFIGTPEHCRAHIAEMATYVGADDVIVCCVGDSFGATIKGFELLAAAFHLNAGSSGRAPRRRRALR